MRNRKRNDTLLLPCFVLSARPSPLCPHMRKSIYLLSIPFNAVQEEGAAPLPPAQPQVAQRIWCGLTFSRNVPQANNLFSGRQIASPLLFHQIDAKSRAVAGRIQMAPLHQHGVIHNVCIRVLGRELSGHTHNAVL